MNKVGRWILIIVVLAAAAGGFFWWRNRQQQALAAGPDILRTGEVIRGDLEITVATSGNVSVNQRTDLRFDLLGEVNDVNVEVGDPVKAGDILAALDTRSLERAVRQSEIALAQAEVNLETLMKPATEEDIALAELAIDNALQSMQSAELSKQAAQAQASFDIRQAQEFSETAEDAYNSVSEKLDDFGLPQTFAAPANAARMEAEGNVGITQVKGEQKIQQAQSQWLAAYNAYQQAQENLRKLEEGPDENQIRQRELQIEQATLNLSQAQQALAKAVITAPFDGIVAAVNIQVGTQPSTALPAISLIDTTEFYIDVTVDETEINKVAVGQAVDITLDAYPDILNQGIVERIGTLPQAANGVVAYPLRIRVTERGPAEIRDGMTASVIIRTSTLENVLLVPNWAVRTDQGTGETYSYYGNREDVPPERTQITVGTRNERYTELISGLAEGQTVFLVTEERNLLEFQGPPSTGR